MPGLLPVAAAALLAASPTPSARATASEALCAQPGVRCPDLVMRRPADVHLLRSPTGRRLLASTNAIVNVGTGPLEIRARRIGKVTMAARQVLRDARGRGTLLPPTDGEVELYDTHGRGVYWKFERAARFELWRLDAGTPTTLARKGPKLDYCYRDLRRERSLATGRPYPGSPRTAHYGACSQDRSISHVTLGTSVGWADRYPSTYPQNWIDVTGLRGCFLYVHRADPANHFVESDEANDATGRTVRLPFRASDPRGGCRVARAVPPAPPI